MSKPISPSEVVALKTERIPPAIFDAFNSMIAKHWDGRAATFEQRAVVDEILERFKGTTREDIFNSKWLDVEESYRAAGWRVDYDRPGYNETYEARFTFTKGPAQ